MRVALTGAASGIGAAVAEILKARGDHVTAFDIAEPKANVDDFIATDLGNPTSIGAAVASVSGPYDALINNAGVPPRKGNEHFVLAVNFFGLRMFLDTMLGKLVDGAAIVNTASRAGAQWRDNLAEVKALMALDPSNLHEFLADRKIDATRAYNLSKEAVIVETMARTQDLMARNLRMNSVSPAAVSTDILADFKAAFGDKVNQNLARSGRAGSPEEIAEVIVFLASPESGWIKGQDILIDGGMSAMIASDQLGLTE